MESLGIMLVLLRFFDNFESDSKTNGHSTTGYKAGFTQVFTMVVTQSDKHQVGYHAVLLGESSTKWTQSTNHKAVVTPNLSHYM